MAMECSSGCKPIKSDQASDLLTARHDAPSVDGPCTARPSWKRLFTPSLGRATQLGLSQVVTRGVHMREHGRQALFIWSPGAAHGIVSTPTWAKSAPPGVVDRGGWWQRCLQAQRNDFTKLVTYFDKLLWPRGLVRRMYQRRQSQELLTQVSWVRIPVAATFFTSHEKSPTQSASPGLAKRCACRTPHHFAAPLPPSQQLCQSNANEVFLFLFSNHISTHNDSDGGDKSQGGSDNETTTKRRRVCGGNDAGGRGGNDAENGAATPPGGQPQRRLDRGGSHVAPRTSEWTLFWSNTFHR